MYLEPGSPAYIVLVSAVATIVTRPFRRMLGMRLTKHEPYDGWEPESVKRMRAHRARRSAVREVRIHRVSDVRDLPKLGGPGRLDGGS